MAKEVPADSVAKWLQDPSTPAFRLGLYGSMLGHSGKPEYAALLRKMLDDPQKQTASGIDGMMAGYVLLKPKEGWEYVRGILKDPSKQFLLRYAALRAVRFFWDTRPDVIDKKEQVDALCLLLDQSDIADLAIEDLRKWKQCQVHGPRAAAVRPEVARRADHQALDPPLRAGVHRESEGRVIREGRCGSRTRPG